MCVSAKGDDMRFYTTYQSFTVTPRPRIQSHTTYTWNILIHMCNVHIYIGTAYYIDVYIYIS